MLAKPLLPAAALAILLLAVACTSDSPNASPEATPTSTGTSTGTGTPFAPPSVTQPPTPSPSPTATPAPTRPYKVTFAPGDLIDVSSAVVFGDLETLEAEAWVIPSASGEFAVSPAGTYVIYRTEDGFQLLRTDDGTVHDLAIGEWPAELGPGDSGFIARGEDGFLGSLFDGQGSPLRDLWLSSTDEPFIASWAPDGQAIAIAQNGGESRNVAMGVWPELTSSSPPTLFRRPVAEDTRPALEWSPDSERLALVTSDAVRVFDRDRTLLWTIEGDFEGNPRWSPDSAHLTVYAVVRVLDRDGRGLGAAPTTYLLTRDGVEVLRIPGAGSCADDPWFDATTFNAGRNLVTVDGTITAYNGPIPDLWPSPESFGFKLAVGLGSHFAHIAARDTSHRLDDGRLVFTTPAGGHGGCGEGTGASEWPAIAVERPPYGPVLSGRASASELLADQPEVLAVIDAVLDAPRGAQGDEIIDLAHRYDALCSFLGELFDHCEAAGLSVTDTFPGIAFGIAICEACYRPVGPARETLDEVIQGETLQLDAVWELPAFDFWPYSAFEDAERRFAISFVRSNWRSLNNEDWLGVLVIVVPEAERPIVVIQPHRAAWTAHDTAREFGNWTPLYLSRPSQPAR